MNEARLSMVQQSPVWQTLGAQVIEAKDGHAVVRYRAREDWLIPSGRVQGGFLAAMLDSCMAAAIVASLAPGQWHTTIEMKVNYFRPAPPGGFTGQSQVIWKGKNIVYAEATLSHESAGLVAKGVSTCMVLKDRSPGSRE